MPAEGFQVVLDRARLERAPGLPRTTGLPASMSRSLSGPGAYDRMAGYFTSSALSLAAAGLSSFIANGGVMRLIVGAQLDPDDVDAIERGEPLSEAVARVFCDPMSSGDAHQRRRRAPPQRTGLARQGGSNRNQGGGSSRPRDGQPLRPAEATKYFHSKYGIFTDCTEDPADRVAFIGSDNETWQRLGRQP